MIIKNPFDSFFKKRELRLEKIQEARNNYTAFSEILGSKGWKVYDVAVDKKIENVVRQMKEDDKLNGEELKRLQLALRVWGEVKRLPKDLEDKAKTR